MADSRLWEASSQISERGFPIRGHPATDGSGGGITNVWSLSWVVRLCIPSTSDLTSKAVGSSRTTSISRVTRTAAIKFLFPTRRFTAAKKGCSAMAMMAPQITGSRKGRMIPMHQAMSRKRTTILMMVSNKGNLAVWFIPLLQLRGGFARIARSKQRGMRSLNCFTPLSGMKALLAGRAETMAPSGNGFPGKAAYCRGGAVSSIGFV